MTLNPQKQVNLSEEVGTVFWYSRRTVPTLLAFTILLVLSISQLIPPLQSPDEFNHLKRAYLLSKGKILPETEKHSTGGRIDTGLLAYMSYFEGVPFLIDNKMNALNLSDASKVAWSGRTQFTDFPNTAAYFPLLYIPQALAFVIGEATGMTVRASYYLARSFSLITVLGLLCAAFLVYPVPLIVLALFVTPMTLFQLGSASLDAVSFATSALAACLFMRGADTKLSFNSPMHVALCICLFSLATTRVNLICMALLPAVLHAIRRSRSYLISSSALIVLSLSWILFSLHTVEGKLPEMPDMGATTPEIVKYYIKHPGSFFQVLYNTFANRDMLTEYWKMFVGILGWLDTPLSPGVYIAFAALFLALALISLQRGWRFPLHRGRLALAFLAIISLCLIPVIALLGWTPHPAKVVIGIQGRYFTTALVFLGFAIFDKRLSVRELRIGLLIVFSMATISICFTEPELLNRYWLDETHEGQRHAYTVQPSTDLNRSSPIKLLMTSRHREQQIGLKRIGVMFRTQGGEISGDAELQLEGPGGFRLSRRFLLAELDNGHYHYFDLDGNRYTTGEIAPVSGEGINTLESHDEKGSVHTCLNYWYIDGKRRFTPGCPLF